LIFSEDAIAQIRDILNLSPRSMLPSSWLRLKTKELEQYDSQYGTAFVSENLDRLDKIKELDIAIAGNIRNNKDNLKREEIKEEYNLEYKDTKDFNLALRQERSTLVGKIAKDLEIVYNPYLTAKSRFRNYG